MPDAAGCLAMASCTNIGKFESLNSFIHERLTTTAGEIFQVVKDTLAEFQEEIYRSKQENIYLKRRLAEVSRGESDAQTKQEPFPFEKQNSNPDPLESEKPVIQVKLELSTVHQDPETQQQLCALPASSFEHAGTTHSSPHSVSNKVGGDKDVDVCMDSYVTVKVEQSDSQVTCSDNASAVHNGSSGTLVGVHKDEPGQRPSSQCVQSSGDRCHPPSCVENSLAGVLFPYAQTNQADEFPVEQQNSNQEPLEYSVIQVKLELSTMEQDSETQQPLCEASTCCVPAVSAKASEPPHYKTGAADEEDVGVCTDSHVTVKLEQCSDELNSCAIQTESLWSQFRNAEDEPGPHPSTQFDFSHQTFNLRSPSTENVHHYKACAKPFRGGLLKTHMVVHHKARTYRCDLCGKCYSTSYALKLHLRTHTGERPYTCKFCVKTFNQKAHVKEHERIHTGEKPYSCSVCGKHFNRTYQVKVHIRNYHPDEVATIIRSRQHK